MAELFAVLKTGAEGDAALAARLRLVVARLARQLRRHAVGGLTPSQLSALASVARLGPVRLGDLADREGIAPPTLTRIVAALEDQGLVGRRADQDDARCSLVELTPAGSTALEAIRGTATVLLASRIATLSPAARDQLAAAVPVLEQLLGDDR